MVCVEPAVEVAEDDNEDDVIEAEATEPRLRLFWESTSNVSSTSAIEVEAMDWLGSNLDKVQALPLMEAAEASLMPTSASGFTEATGCSSIKLASTITMETEAVELSLLLSSLPDFKEQQQQHSLIILNEILPKATN